MSILYHRSHLIYGVGQCIRYERPCLTRSRTVSICEWTNWSVPRDLGCTRGPANRYCQVGSVPAVLAKPDRSPTTQSGRPVNQPVRCLTQPAACIALGLSLSQQNLSLFLVCRCRMLALRGNHSADLTRGSIALNRDDDGMFPELPEFPYQVLPEHRLLLQAAEIKRSLRSISVCRMRPEILHSCADPLQRFSCMSRWSYARPRL